MKIYYDDGTIRVRDMIREDAQVLYDTYLSYGWHPDMKTYEDYLLKEGPFAGNGWPEIVDLCVFFHIHNKGIGSKLLDVAEQEASRFADHVFLAVGVHSGYGRAQRIYVSRGYNFDGSGVWYKGKQLEQYAECCNDDDLLLFMSKPL